MKKQNKCSSNQLAHVTRRRGSVLVYSFFLMIVMFAFVSFGVDFGRMESVKTEMQRNADAVARGALQIYLTYGAPTANFYAPLLAGNGYNPVDANSGVTPTVSVVWGSWDTNSRTFTAGGSSPVAVKVTISRTTATGNAMKLTFPLINGVSPVRTTCDVWAQSIAYIAGGQTGSVSFQSTASLYLSGMPAGSTTAGYGDSTSNAGAYQVVSVPVTPGTYITFTNLSGTTSIVPGYVTPVGPAGNSGDMLHHGENYDHNPDPGYTNPENGIADATMPADAMCGVFLTNNPPTSSTAPAAVDWTPASQYDKATYTNIVTQQPFLIGSGTTSGGTVKQFLVPPNATQLFLSIWDGVCYNNNSGTMSGTISVQQTILLAK